MLTRGARESVRRISGLSFLLFVCNSFLLGSLFAFAQVPLLAYSHFLFPCSNVRFHMFQFLFFLDLPSVRRLALCLRRYPLPPCHLFICSPFHLFLVCAFALLHLCACSSFHIRIFCTCIFSRLFIAALVGEPGQKYGKGQKLRTVIFLSVFSQLD